MPAHFFDTSALSKLYHAEKGSEIVNRIFLDSQSQSLIATLTILEMESVLARKQRSGELSTDGFRIAKAGLRADLAQRRLIIAAGIEDFHLRHARTLLERYGVTEGLRTLDAIQLAICLDLSHRGKVQVLVAADRRMCAVADLCGVPTMNPETFRPTIVLP